MPCEIISNLGRSLTMHKQSVTAIKLKMADQRNSYFCVDFTMSLRVLELKKVNKFGISTQGVLAMFSYGGVRAMFLGVKFHLKAIGV